MSNELPSNEIQYRLQKVKYTIQTGTFHPESDADWQMLMVEIKNAASDPKRIVGIELLDFVQEILEDE